VKRGFTSLTGRRHHALPLLEEGGLEAVAGGEGVGLVARHELLHRLEDHAEAQVVERGVGDALARDVFGQLLQHAGVLRRVQRHHRPRDQLAVRAHRQVPRLDAHQVVERELQNQTTLRAHLSKLSTISKIKQ
jgi:hypothetical protein